MPNDGGGPGGLICANTDDTRRVIGERQIATIKDLARGAENLRDAERWPIEEVLRGGDISAVAHLVKPVSLDALFRVLAGAGHAR